MVECVDETVSQDMSEEIVDPNCGLHMSCTSSFANFGSNGDQLDPGILTEIALFYCNLLFLQMYQLVNFVILYLHASAACSLVIGIMFGLTHTWKARNSRRI